MPIDTGAILVGGTTSTTGGTSTPFTIKGDSNGEKSVILDDGTTYIDSSRINFTVKDPVANAGAPNGYTQQRSSVRVVVPFLLDNGNYTSSTISIGIAYDVELTDAEKDALMELGAQLIRTSSFDDFWKKQSLA
jgi:hypothetical protein